ncbi:putative reverse transcriptase domain-containing protein [Tanacetum coccineum]|uniref:Reverse transcriptase domain-containing protein n=1 Tax=Tanacetum coccineum TaxID=301880 RepID=A0ABQ5GNA3_9ASTR
MSSSTVTYTSISSDSDLPPWGFHLMDPSEFEAPYLEYPKYVAPADDEIPIKVRPLPTDSLPTALSPSYVANFDPSNEDLEEDPADYPADRGDMIYSCDEAQKTVRLQPPMAASIEALIAEFASAPTPPSPQTSPLSPWSSPLLQIPSPPLHVLSPPLPLPSPPTHTSPTYAEATLGYRAAMIQLRAASLLHVPSPPFIRASENRLMTVVEDINQRMTDLATTQRQDAHELHAQVRTLHTQHEKMEWQRQDAGDLVTTAFGRIHALEARDRAHTRDAGPQNGPADVKMTPKRTTTPMYDDAIKALVARSVANALVEHEANRSRNGDDSFESGGDGGRRTMCGRMFPGESDEIEKYVNGLPDMIQGSVMASKPKIMQDAIKAYTAGSGEKKEYGGSLPLCTKCNYHHNGQCAPRCNNCKKVGHLDRDCRGSAAAANNQRAIRVNQRVVTCFEYGVQGHYKKDCPKQKNNNRGNQAGNGGATTRAYAVGNAGKNPDSNVVIGMFLLNNQYAFILFDTGADKSFVSTAFSSLIDIVPTTLDHYYDVELADRKIIRVYTIIMPVELGSFDVIIGIHWLVKYHAVIICDEKIVHIPFGNEILIIHGNKSNNGHESQLNIISCTKTQKYLLKECDVFFAHVTTKKAEDKLEEK